MFNPFIILLSIYNKIKITDDKLKIVARINIINVHEKAEIIVTIAATDKPVEKKNQTAATDSDSHIPIFSPKKRQAEPKRQNPNESKPNIKNTSLSPSFIPSIFNKTE